MPCDAARARDLYEQACEAGSSAAAYFMGHRLHIGDDELGILADGERALTLLRRASQQVGTSSCFFKRSRSITAVYAICTDSGERGADVLSPTSTRDPYEREIPSADPCSQHLHTSIGGDSCLKLYIPA